MQLSQVEQDSPYLLWQYVNLLTPAKPEYPVHPAFTHPSAGQQMSYLHEHSLNSYLHEQNLNGYHPHPSHPTPSHVHRVSPLTNFKLNNETHCKRTAHATKRSFKTRTDRHISVSTEQSKLTTHAQSNNSTSSPIKGSSFTIDAILKNDRNKPSKSTSSPTNTTSSCPVPESCYSPNTPTTHGYFYGQPLLHSTPTMDTPDRRHSRVHDLSHPYLYPQFDAHPTFHASPHVLPLTPLASSSSSLSGSSSPSTSPESHALHRAEKAERKCPGKPKRIRTIFTQEQLEKLEAEFERQQYMVGTERYYLAATLNLTEAQVKVWFQNRRIKWRKQHLELQHARLAQCDLYKDLDEETDDTDTEDKHGSDVRRPDIHTDTSNGEASFSS